MDFKQAFQLMNQGKKIRRKCFAKGEYYYIDPMQGCFTIHLKNGKEIKYGNLNVLVKNVLADDFEEFINEEDK